MGLIHEKKRKALNIIMSQYAEDIFQFTDSNIDKTSVIRIEVDSMTGKRSGFYKLSQNKFNTP
ncbi:MAG: hypothetical protein FP814_13090 [Desulfobacterium sp.]|nr:hypothetical protein [Desulfobacterium sp.]